MTLFFNACCRQVHHSESLTEPRSRNVVEKIAKEKKPVIQNEVLFTWIFWPR